MTVAGDRERVDDEDDAIDVLVILLLCRIFAAIVYLTCGIINVGKLGYALFGRLNAQVIGPGNHISCFYQLMTMSQTPDVLIIVAFVLWIGKGDGVVQGALVGFLELFGCCNDEVRFTGWRAADNRDVDISASADARVHLVLAAWANACDFVALNPASAGDFEAQGGQARLTLDAAVRKNAVDTGPELGMWLGTGRADKGGNVHLFMAIGAAEKDAIEARIDKGAERQYTDHEHRDGGPDRE